MTKNGTDGKSNLIAYDEKQKNMIRLAELMIDGVPIPEIAKEFGCNPSTIRRQLNRKAYKELFKDVAGEHAVIKARDFLGATGHEVSLQNIQAMQVPGADWEEQLRFMGQTSVKAMFFLAFNAFDEKVRLDALKHVITASGASKSESGNITLNLTTKNHEQLALVIADLKEIKERNSLPRTHDGKVIDVRSESTN